MTHADDTSGSVILPQWLKEATMKKAVTFAAEDGTVFTSAAECKAHEARASNIATVMNADELAIGLAMDGDVEWKELAAALEAIGTVCAKARRVNGDVKRKSKSAEPEKKAA